MISAFSKLFLSFLFILLFQTNVFAQIPAGNAGAGNTGGSNGWWQGVDTEEFANGEIRDAYCDLIDLMEGSFGGMLMAVAGIIAFATAAFGDLKHGITTVVVGISSFAIAALTSLYFGQLCEGRGINGINNNLDLNPNAIATAAATARTGFIPNQEEDNNSDPFDF